MDAGSPAGWEFGHFGNRAGRHGNANAGARSEEGEEETEAGPAGGGKGKPTLPWIPRKKTNISRMVFTSRLTGTVGIPPPTGSERGRTQVGTRGQRRMEVR